MKPKALFGMIILDRCFHCSLA